MNDHGQQKPVSVNYCGGTRTPWLPLLTFLLVAGVLLSSCGTPASEAAIVTKTPVHTPTPVPPTPTPTPVTPTPTPTPRYPPAVAPSAVLGIDGNPSINYAGIPWIRLGYPTCGQSKMKGIVLKNTIASYHKEGVRVLLSICQWTSGPNLFQTAPLLDAAQGGADAVQCGNEQMKYGAFNMYITPSAFARFYDNCQRIMHTVRPDIPIIIGSLDPLIAGTGYNQVAYLNEMQYAMNTQVHPGGNWNWRTQIVGLIDSWHNGYPGPYVNNLYGLFVYWARQIGVSLTNGDLGKHLWVIEGTGCFKGCGIDPYNSYQVAVSHILALITDVQTSMNYAVPFFFFSGTDFQTVSGYWPIGVMNVNGHPKPLRQDLWMGARTFQMSCAVGPRVVQDQEQLLMRLYMRCTLPYNYVSILES
jgi:hypothetical protein